ncbi:DUF3618 domain-containing protein [Actinomycetaceae bacterium L2_0104]
MTTPETPRRMPRPDSKTDSYQRPEPDGDAAVRDIEADIAQTRRDLGETVEQLASALDVKSRAKDQLNAAKERATEQFAHAQEQVSEGVTKAREKMTEDDGRPNSMGWTVIGAIGAALGLIVILGLRRKRS